MRPVEQPQNQPIYWDSHRGTINLTLILSLAVVVLGLFQFLRDGEPTLMIIGLGVAGFTWFTNAKQYWIYSDALVIVYGRPRVKAIPFSQISHVELLSLPMGDRLRVRLVRGRGVMLQARDCEAFQDRLESAMNDYQGGRSLEETREEGSEDEETR